MNKPDFIPISLQSEEERILKKQDVAVLDDNF